MVWTVGVAAAVHGAAGPVDSVWRSLAQPSGFRSGDWDLTVNYSGAAQRPLPAVSALLRNPRAADSLVPALRGAIGSSGPAGGAPLWPWLGLPVPLPCRDAVENCLKRTQTELQTYVKPLSPGEIDFLRREIPDLLRHRADDTTLNPYQIEAQRLDEEAAADSIRRLDGRLDKVRLAQAASALDASLDRLMAEARGPGGVLKVAALLRKISKAGIPVVFGSAGDDIHKVSQGVVFDPGGRDRYVFPDTARPGSWLLVLDAAGNDVYQAVDTVGGAAAFLSLQAIADLEGDDRYIGKDMAFASAALGYARLYDAAGDDLYEARCASLGFAFQGLALLEDGGGNDLYSGWFLAQGASGPGGLAVLADRAGHDQYLARPAFVDDLRYRDHFLSLSQGFSTGLSQKQAGGIAVLWDGAGEDLYSADIFAQGSGYWFAWGLLLEDAGNDKFLAHQYAQGAGVHFAAGTLWDGAGNDLRVSKGVSQGCGHDGGFGLLADGGGSDRHLAVDMSLGAGSANGLGIFADLGGDDFYEGENPAMTLGHGDLRRDRGSLGFFFDAVGRDRYPPGFRNGSTWRTYDGQKRGEGYGRDAE